MLFTKENPAETFYGHSMNYYKGSLYIFGGTNGYEFYNTMYRLNLSTKVFRKLKVTGQVPQARYKHQTVIYNNQLYMSGGRGKSVQDKIKLLSVFDFNSLN